MWFPKSHILTLRDVTTLSQQLATRVKYLHLDCVVSIESGGWFVGTQIAQQLDLPHQQVTIRRFDDEELRNLYRKFPQSLHFVPALYQAAVHPTRKPQLIKRMNDPDSVEGKRILLVDDVIHTGRTIAVAKDYLYGLWSGSIYVAALATVRGFHETTFYTLQGHYFYPWSRISPEYEAFQKIHQRGHLMTYR